MLFKSFWNKEINLLLFVIDYLKIICFISFPNVLIIIIDCLFVYYSNIFKWYIFKIIVILKRKETIND